jgi:hypothetical protein
MSHIQGDEKILFISPGLKDGVQKEIFFFHQMNLEIENMIPVISKKSDKNAQDKKQNKGQ